MQVATHPDDAVTPRDPVAQETWHDFQSVIQEAAPRLFRIAVSMLGNIDDAEDAVQETALAAWRHWSSTSAYQDAGPWLTRICVHRCIDRRRRGWGRLVPLRFASAVAAPSTLSFDPDLEGALIRLPGRQQAVLVLHYQHGYSLDDCAHLLGCRPGTARSHLARGLAALRKELGDD